MTTEQIQPNLKPDVSLSVGERMQHPLFATGVDDPGDAVIEYGQQTPIRLCDDVRQFPIPFDAGHGKLSSICDNGVAGRAAYDVRRLTSISTGN